MSCITFSSDIMTKVYAYRVIVIQFCNSLGVCCIPTGGGAPPWTPPPQRPGQPPPPPFSTPGLHRVLHAIWICLGLA